MKRVYVAGAFSADNVLEVLSNMRNGMRAATRLFLLGYAPFCPWLGYQYSLMLRENEEVSTDDFYDYSIAWLKVSDMMVVLPNSNHSRGTQREIAIAKDMGIPIYYDIEEFIKEQP